MRNEGWMVSLAGDLPGYLTALLESQADDVVSEWAERLTATSLPWENYPREERERICRRLYQAVIAAVGALTRGALRVAADRFVRDADTMGLRPPEIHRGLQALRYLCLKAIRQAYARDLHVQVDASQRINDLLDALVVDCSDACDRISYTQYEYRLRELEMENRGLQQAVARDPLTGLYNRGYFDERLSQEVRRARRQQRPLALVLFDIDRFKSINDQYGHPMGDAAIRTVGQFARRLVRIEDFPARIGGDEFALLLPDANIDQGVVPAERLRAAVASTEIGETLHVSLSLGLAIFTTTDTEATFVERADQALYASKGRGGNTLTIASFDENPHVMSLQPFDPDATYDREIT